MAAEITSPIPIIDTEENTDTTDSSINTTTDTLPSNYTKIEYIQSDSGQYIDTGFIPDSDTRVIMTFQVVDYTSAWRCILGQRASSNTNDNTVSLWLDTSGRFAAYWSSSQNSLFSTSVLQTDKHTIDINKNVYTLDKEVVTLSATTFTGQCTLCLGISHSGTTYEYNCSERIFACKIYDNGTLVRDYVPCINSSGIHGLYDLVNNQFYQSGNGADFIYPINPNAELLFEMDDATLDDKINSNTPTIQGSAKIRRNAEYHALKFNKSTSSTYDCVFYENNDNYNVTNSDWTFEWWEYRFDTGDIREATFSYNSTQNSNGGFVIGSPSNGKLRFFSNSETGSSWDNGIVSDIGTITKNTWIHRALCFNHATKTWTSYQNGEFYKTGTLNSASFDTSSALAIGARYCNKSDYYGSMSGFLCGLKIWRGQRYLSSFTVPKFPLQKDTSLKLHISGQEIKDVSNSNLTITNQNVSLSTTQTRGGHTHSLYFNGSSRLLINYTDDLDLTSDFTIEWWEYSTSSSNNSRFCTSYTADTYTGLLFGYQGTYLYVGNTGSAWNIFSSVNCIDVVANTWVHRAISKKGSEWSIYKNGVRTWVGNNSACLPDFPEFPFAIGDYRSGDHSCWTGYIDDFKVYTHAKYSGAIMSIQAGSILNFDYTGAVQTITLPKGTYKLECWGAQGGQGADGTTSNTSWSYGKGGYSSGILSLKDKTVLFIYSGGHGWGYQGSTHTSGLVAGGFNGGGNAYHDGGEFGGSGGGASDIRINNDSLYARVIVAGGGGGSGEDNESAGYGGGISSSGYSSSYQATQTNAGTNGSFGQGANYKNSGESGGGGGGGWYGGGGGEGSGSGGGSGYVYTASTASNYPSGCLLNSSYYLTDAQTIAGNTSFTSPSGSPETGHTGNGYCRITVIQCSSTKINLRLNNSIKKVSSFYAKINGMWRQLSDRFSNISLGQILNFPYSGKVEQILLPAGQYKLECWGAQGGYRSSSSYGGKGGYSVGTITLEKETVLYIYAGGAGNTVTTASSSIYPGGFNGGGYRYGYKGGGGASDFRIGTDSLYSRVIVAGGGGSDGSSSCAGGAGGGTSGVNGSGGYYSTYKGTGGTQTGNSAGHTCNTSQGTTNSSSNCPGGFGFGGFGAYTSSGYGGAGGGGWYGGEGTYPDGSGDDDYGGGGGSGYIYTSSTASNYPSGCLLNSSHYLTGAQTINGATAFTSPSGASETGHTGDGYCRITVLSIESQKENIKMYVKNNSWKQISI